MQFDQLLSRLQALPRSELERVSKGTNVPVHTIIKVWNGKTPNPRVRTVEALRGYFGK